MEYIIHLLLLIVSAATIHGQDLTAEAQLDISVGEIRGTGTSFNIQVWLGNPASWREWGPWGACSGSCGVGLQTRSRRCWIRETEIITTVNERDITGEAANNQGLSPNARQGEFSGIVTGEGCFGYAAQVRGCPLVPCVGTLLPWGPWSQCGVTCGSSTRFRRRVCQGPGTCVGDLNDSEPCGFGPCYSWTEWTSYSACSTTCGSGQSFRTRKCATPDGTQAPDISACPDVLNLGTFQSQPCSIGRCYSLTQWSEYSTCSATCGNGQSFRTRQCVATDGTVDLTFAECPGSFNNRGFEIQACNLGRCYRFTDWTSWSSCSVACGDGRITRTRRCIDIATNVDAPDFSSCEDLDRLGVSQSQSCNIGLCYSWTQWTEYSTCTATCGNGQLFRNRQCVATDGTVDPTFAGCPDLTGLGGFEAQTCNVQLCYSWTRWSEYSTCSATCGDGQSFRNRQCVATDGTVDNTFSECPDLSGLGGFEAITCNLKLCYSWTQWTEYSTCTATCGNGQSFRSRQCVATDGTVDSSFAECPDPFNNRNFETQTCNLGRCYQFTEWTSWTSCSASCGDGQIGRSRKCIDIATNLDARDFKSCDDPLNLGIFQSQRCNLGLCYSWTRWSEYSTCTATCGDGQSFRSRQCVATDGTIDPTNAECPDQTGLGGFEAITCNLKLCYSWSRWSEYSTCSATCGDGQSFRSRQCVATDGTIDNTLAECPDLTGLGQLETRRCNQGQCYQFTEWTSWTSCSVACGDGQITRTRRCIAIATNIDAVDFSSCEDPNNLGVYQSQQCNLGLCYSWTRWSEYSTCTTTCGDGQSFRSRQCVATDGTIDPTNAECPDQTGLGGFEAITCNLKLCYSWSLWSEYSTCSATCGDGQSFRSRQCVATDGTVDNNFAECPDLTGLRGFETQSCFLKPCYSWTEWTPFSECSVSCGDGQSFRSRSCSASDGSNAPSPAECPDPENLSSFQTQSCRLGACYGFTEWTEWTTCSVTCGQGQITRRRRCIDIGTNLDAPIVSSCFDPEDLGVFQRQPCNLKLCYSWTQWTQYSQCSASCGEGQSFRTRRCIATDGTEDLSLKECPDVFGRGSFEGQNCNLGPCYSWTIWSGFSDCSVTCGSGIVSRARRCSTEKGDISSDENCIIRGQDGAFDTRDCQQDKCYFWTAWSAYSPCSTTCGDGQSFRSRTCSATDGTITNDRSKCGNEKDPFNLDFFQRQDCNLGPCYRFAEWGAWSRCDSRCGQGNMQRVRSCVTINGQSGPNSGCSNNPDDFIIRATCMKPACPGVFRQWSQWGQCSLTCHAGVRVRTRACSTDRCIGRSREAQICNDISCDDRPIGRWTAWSNWSPCTNPCGGTSTQTRVCIGGRSSTDCGRDCEEYRRTKTCTDCPRGGPFSIGSCSVLENVREDCGFGGISPEECAFRQCCYDDTVAPGIPWCYEQSQNFILNVGAQRSLQPPTPPAPVSATAPTPAAVNNASTEAADGN